MISFLRVWANQIIVAVIIATILEMLLPEGKNKKYIKMIIGIYVLFCIINPIITKATGTNLDISKFDYEKYFDKDVIETTSQEFENNNSKLIKQAYIDNIKNDIKTKIKQKGYEVISLEIEIIEDEDSDTYGKIHNVNLKLEKLENEEKNKKESIIENAIKIENVDININSNTINNESNNVKEKSNISDNGKVEIIEYLSNEYSIDKKSIVIN